MTFKYSVLLKARFGGPFVLSENTRLLLYMSKWRFQSILRCFLAYPHATCRKNECVKYIAFPYIADTLWKALLSPLYRVLFHTFHRVFNIQLLFCTPAVERKAAPALSTSLSHCIHKPVENHRAAPFHTFSDFSTSSPAPTTNTTNFLLFFYTWALGFRKGSYSHYEINLCQKRIIKERQHFTEGCFF